MRFGEINHINDLYDFNKNETNNRIEQTHGGASKLEDWKKDRTKILLCCVPWDDTYKNVIDWSKNNKSEYFKNIKGRKLETSTAWNLKKLEVFKPSLNGYVGEIDLNLTFEEALLYNYVVVYQEKQPTARGEAIEEFYFFVSSFDKIAPNTTRLTIHNDIWTQYQQHFNFMSGTLTRGHLLHHRAKTEDFFDNPLLFQYDIFEEEPDTPNVKRYTPCEKYFLISDKIKIVIASTAFLGELNNKDLGAKFWENIDTNSGYYSNNWGEKTYSGNPDGNGSRGWSFTGESLNNTITPEDRPIVKYGDGFKKSTSQLNFYALTPQDFEKFCLFLSQHAPYLFKHIKSIFILPDIFLNSGLDVTIFGGFKTVKITPSTETKKIGVINLTPEDFNFSSSYFAKLYTPQYSTIKITNNTGAAAYLNFSDFSNNVEIYSRASTVYPFLKLDTFISGIGSQQINKYEFKGFDAKKIDVFTSLTAETLFNYDVPTYGLIISGENRNVDQWLENNTKVDANKLSATISKLKTQKNYYNSFNTILKNLSQSVYSARKTKTIADRSNQTNKTTSDNDNLTTFNNGQNSNNTTNTNNINQINTADTVANKNFDFTHDQQQRDIENDFYFKNTLDRYYSVKPISQALDWINARTPWKLSFSAAATAAGGGIHLSWPATFFKNFFRTSDTMDTGKTGAQTSDKPTKAQTQQTTEQFGGGQITCGGPSTGDILGAVQQGGQIALELAQFAQAVEWEKEEKRFSRELIREQNDKYATETKNFNTTQNDLLLDKSKEVNNIDISAQKTRENNRYATENTIQNRTRNNNANNININYETTAQNNTDEYTAGVTNSEHTQKIETLNAQNIYDIDVIENDSNNRIKEAELNNSIYMNQIGKFDEFGQWGGDNFNIVETGAGGVSVQIERISKADELKTLNIFNRYGYRCNMPIGKKDFNNLSLFTNFTYWEFSEVWGVVDGNETAASFFRSMFVNGVTVWTNPANIYDYEENIRL